MNQLTNTEVPPVLPKELEILERIKHFKKRRDEKLDKIDQELNNQLADIKEKYDNLKKDEILHAREGAKNKRAQARKICKNATNSWNAVLRAINDSKEPEPLKERLVAAPTDESVQPVGQPLPLPLPLPESAQQHNPQE